MLYVRLTKPYTGPCNLFKAFGLVTAANSFIIIHSQHQSPAVAEPFLEPLKQAQPHRLQPQLLQFLIARATERSHKNIAWTKLDKIFVPPRQSQDLQEWPRTQKQPSMMSAIICACIKGLLPISTATSLCLAKYITFNLI